MTTRQKSKYYRVLTLVLLIGGALLTALAPQAHSRPTVDLRNDPEFDRLDGTGKSRKKVHVVDFEGNMEIHVYPAGSLVGLGLKIDNSKKDKVMVISYRFDTEPEQPLIRRAILTMPLREGFRAYKDPTVTEYDKVVITMNRLGDEMVAYRLESPPLHLFPAGHPERQDRELASKDQAHSSDGSPRVAGEADFESHYDQDGTITPFLVSPARQRRQIKNGDAQMLRQ